MSHPLDTKRVDIPSCPVCGSNPFIQIQGSVDPTPVKIDPQQGPIMRIYFSYVAKCPSDLHHVGVAEALTIEEALEGWTKLIELKEVELTN